MAHFLFQDCHRRANSQRGVLCPIFVNQLSNSLFHCFDGHASSHRFQVALWIATIVSTEDFFGLPLCSGSPIADSHTTSIHSRIAGVGCVVARRRKERETERGRGRGGAMEDVGAGQGGWDWPMKRVADEREGRERGGRERDGGYVVME